MYLCSPCSHATGLRSISLVVLGFVPRSLLQGWRSPPHPLHPPAAGELWHPLPRAGGTGWMCASQLYETAVTYEVAHTHVYCQYLTLGLWCYYCWTSKKKEKKKSAHLLLILQTIWVYNAVESHSCCRSSAGHQLWSRYSLWMYYKGIWERSSVQSLTCGVTSWMCSEQQRSTADVLPVNDENQVFTLSWEQQTRNL